MRGTTFQLLSYLLFALAVVACGASAFLAWDFSGRLADRAALESSASTAASQQESAVRTHAIAQDTAGARATLDQLMQTDLLSIAGEIKSAGSAAGAQTTIGSVSSLPLTTKAPANLNEVEFIVQSQGSFAQVLQAARLFETLPLPSGVEELDFEHLPSAGSSAHSVWQLTARIQVLTDAPLSS